MGFEVAELELLREQLAKAQKDIKLLVTELIVSERQRRMVEAKLDNYKDQELRNSFKAN